MPQSMLGEKNPQAKLKKEHIYIIRKLYAEKKHSQIALGVLFGVNQSQISRIVNNQRWSDTKEAQSAPRFPSN